MSIKSKMMPVAIGVALAVGMGAGGALGAHANDSHRPTMHHTAPTEVFTPTPKPVPTTAPAKPKFTPPTAHAVAPAPKPTAANPVEWTIMPCAAWADTQYPDLPLNTYTDRCTAPDGTIMYAPAN